MLLHLPRFCAYFSLQTLQFLLVGVQKYFCFRAQVPLLYLLSAVASPTHPEGGGAKKIPGEAKYLLSFLKFGGK